jgi:transcriptional regulator with XRE-family HTH domain
MTSLRVLLASNIKKRRKKLGLTQEELAEKVATSTHYIGQIEQKNKFPTPEMLERIAAALGIDSPQLFSMAAITEEAVQRFQEAVLADMETALARTIETRAAGLKKPD